MTTNYLWNSFRTYQLNCDHNIMWTKSCFFKWIPKYYLRKVDDSGVFDFVYIQVSMNKNETRIRRELRWKLLDWLSLQSPSKELAVVVKLQDLHFILCTNALWLHAYHLKKKDLFRWSLLSVLLFFFFAKGLANCWHRSFHHPREQPALVFAERRDWRRKL